MLDCLLQLCMLRYLQHVTLPEASRNSCYDMLVFQLVFSADILLLFGL